MTSPARITLPSPMPTDPDDLRLVNQAVSCLAEVWDDQDFSMTLDPGRPGQPSDVTAFCTRDGLDHMYTFEPAEFTCGSAVTDGGWEAERALSGIIMDGIFPYDTQAVVWSIRRHHEYSLAAIRRD